MEVNAGCLDAGMPEQVLDHKDVRSRFQQVGGEAMPQRVNTYRFCDVGFFFASLNSCCTASLLIGFPRRIPGKSQYAGRCILQ
jgi:hypothetical protein